jgi:hypothetical protein
MNPRTAPIAHRTAPASAPARSRAEALRRSLLAAEAVPEEDRVMQVRATGWAEALQPRDAFQTWLVGQVATLSFGVDRCHRMERRLRERASLRAEVCWDDDRAGEAEALGGGLADRPASVVDRLRRTAAGCDWLIRRWALLAWAADQGPWTAEQVAMAFDLLGTPPEFRSGPPGAAIDEQGRVIAGANDPAAVARGQVGALRERRDRLAGAEEVDRALIVADLFDDPSPEIRRLRRHEAALQGRIRWCMAQLRPTASRPEPQPGPEVAPDWLPDAPPVPGPRARPSRPPIGPAPGPPPEFGADLDEAAFQESRREVRAMLAEFHRDQAGRPGRPGA